MRGYPLLWFWLVQWLPRSHSVPPPGSNPGGGADPPIFMTCERKTRVPGGEENPPFLHHLSRWCRSGRRSSSGNFFVVWTESRSRPRNLCKHPVNFARVFVCLFFYSTLVPHIYSKFCINGTYGNAMQYTVHVACNPQYIIYDLDSWKCRSLWLCSV